MIRYADVPMYEGTIERGTMPAVSSQPKAPAVFVCVSAPLKWSSQPLLLLNGFSSTPKKTSPLGPTVGEAEPSSGRFARLLGLRTSLRSILLIGARVVLLRARR